MRYTMHTAVKSKARYNVGANGMALKIQGKAKYQVALYIRRVAPKYDWLIGLINRPYHYTTYANNNRLRKIQRHVKRPQYKSTRFFLNRLLCPKCMPKYLQQIGAKRIRFEFYKGRMYKHNYGTGKQFVVIVDVCTSKGYKVA